MRCVFHDDHQLFATCTGTQEVNDVIMFTKMNHDLQLCRQVLVVTLCCFGYRQQIMYQWSYWHKVFYIIRVRAEWELRGSDVSVHRRGRIIFLKKTCVILTTKKKVCNNTHWIPLGSAKATTIHDANAAQNIDRNKASELFWCDFVIERFQFLSRIQGKYSPLRVLTATVVLLYWLPSESWYIRLELNLLLSLERLLKASEVLSRGTNDSIPIASAFMTWPNVPDPITPWNSSLSSGNSQSAS